jgi:lipopolysaccharide transport system ATP-binding protein
MSDIVIKAENIGKKYVIGHQAERGGYTALRDVLMQNARTLWNKTKDLATGKPIIQGDTMEEVWALKDVSFEIRRGEAVGIIGRNGAGKSTLLKILSRITEPSTGRVTIKGRVASLLEVGTGFHPELTGRENIYLNGTILGMTREEIKQKFDEIVAFAEVEKYLDTPVKRYSSGMYVRLAFAVAAHLEPEILVVDEVLAVGDAAFQKKCLGKMGDVAKEGRTVLFVSHNMTAVKSLCKEGVLLRDGLVACMGEINQVVNTYLSTDRSEVLEKSWDSIESAPGNNWVRVKHIKLIQATGTETDNLTVRTPFHVRFEFWVLQPALLNLSMHVNSIGGETIFANASPTFDCVIGIARFTCDIPGDLMNDGVYSIQMMIVKDSTALFVLNDAAVFEVHDVERTGNWMGKWPGALRPKLAWEHELIPLENAGSE